MNSFLDRSRWPVVLAVVLTGLLLGAGPASAHSSLVTTNPSPGADLDAAPASIDLTFDQDVSDQRPMITLSDGIGRDVEMSAPSVSGPFVTARIESDLEPGKFTVSYGVDSADGDPVTGEFTFRITGLVSGDGQTERQDRRDGRAPSGPVLADVSAATHKGSDGLDCRWLWGAVAGAIILLSAGIGAFLVVGSRKDRKNGT